MKLTLDKKEVVAIIEEWAEKKFPSQFNAVEIDGSSYSREFITLSRQPAKEDSDD